MVKKCKICGDAVPLGKELCWCCEHGPKLHTDKLRSDPVYKVNSTMATIASDKREMEVAG